MDVLNDIAQSILAAKAIKPRALKRPKGGDWAEVCPDKGFKIMFSGQAKEARALAIWLIKYLLWRLKR